MLKQNAPNSTLPPRVKRVLDAWKMLEIGTQMREKLLLTCLKRELYRFQEKKQTKKKKQATMR